MTALRRKASVGAAAAAALLLTSSTTLASQSYPDRLGDVKGGGGPDIASIAVSNTKAAVTFRVRFANAPPLRVSTREQWIDMLLVTLDVPPFGPSPIAGGEWRGADFALGAHGPSKTGLVVRLGKGTYRPAARFAIVTTGPTVKFSVARRALGNSTAFRFTVAAGREMSDESSGGGSDFAPARGSFRYGFTG